MGLQRDAQASASEVGVSKKADSICLLLATEPPGMSDAVIAELSKVADVTVMSPPGFDGTSLPSTFSSIDDLAYQQLDYLEKKNLRNVALVGVSFAAWIALEMGVRSTQSISHLIIADALGVRTGDPLHQPIADIYAMSPEEVRMAMFASESYRSWQPGALSDEQLLQFTRARETQVILGWNRYMHNPVLERWLHRITVPSLVLWGSDDGIVAPSLGHHITNKLPNASFSLVDGAGHYPHIEQPEKFSEKVALFAGLAEAQKVGE